MYLLCIIMLYFYLDYLVIKLNLGVGFFILEKRFS